MLRTSVKEPLLRLLPPLVRCDCSAEILNVPEWKFAINKIGRASLVTWIERELLPKWKMKIEK